MRHNITHFVVNLNVGGLEQLVVELIRQQVKDGHRCQVLCLTEKGVLAEKLEREGIEIYPLHKKNGFDFNVIRQARRFIKSFKTDILHTHDAVPQYYGALSSFLSSVKCILNTRHSSYQQSIFTKQEFLYRASLAFSNAAVCVSESARKEFVSSYLMPSSKAFVVKNGVNLEALVKCDMGSKEKIRKRLPIKDTDIIIGSVGRLNPVKNHLSLISSFSKILNKKDNVSLVIVGDGPCHDMLKKKVRALGLDKKIVFLGEREDVHDLMCSFDIYVQPSLSEGYSMALLEACAAGLPIVTTDVGGNSEIVKHNANGLLIKPDDENELSHSLLQLVNDEFRRTKMGEAGYDWVSKNGSIITMKQLYYGLYKGEK